MHTVDNIFNNTANTSAPNLGTFGSAPQSVGGNLASDDGGGYLTGNGDIINVDPLLGPLQNNGGPTQTHALLPGSPAINAGLPSEPGDQRKYPRIGPTDIGAFEFGSAPVLITAIQRFSDGSVQLDGKGLLNATFTIQASSTLNLTSGNFSRIGSAISNDFGEWHYTDTGSVGLTKRFHRATYP